MSGKLAVKVGRPIRSITAVVGVCGLLVVPARAVHAAAPLGGGAGVPTAASPVALQSAGPAIKLRSFSHVVNTAAIPASVMGKVHVHIDPVPKLSPIKVRPPSRTAGTAPDSSPEQCTNLSLGGTPCAPPLKYHGGPVQHHPLIVLIFWGPKWYHDPNGIVTAEMNMFRDLGNQSQTNLAHYWMGTLSEYCDNNGCPASDVSLFENTAFIDTTAPPTIDQGGKAAVHEIDSFNSAFGFSETPDTQYILIPQDGAKIEGSGFCAYHDWTTKYFFGLLGERREWSIIPDLATWDQRCLIFDVGGATDIDYAMERVTTHEFAETVTDGFGNGWFARNIQEEIGDMCNEIPDAGQILPDTNIWAQYLWDNVTGGGGVGLNNCVRSIYPDAPMSVSATYGSSNVPVNWSPASSDNGQPVTGYAVTAYTGAGQSAGTQYVSGSTLSVTFSGLGGGSFFFGVRAKNSFGWGPPGFSSPFTVFPMTTATALAQALAGSGVKVSPALYSGTQQAAGRFIGGDGVLGIGTGVVLSSGVAADVVGPPEVDAISSVNSTPGDGRLSALVGFPTFDAAELTFNVVPSHGTLSLTYVFGSAEYDFWVNSEFNDVMAIFVDGHDCATLPGGTPVSVNGVNAQTNSAFFKNNDPSYVNATIGTTLHGLTTVLKCVAPVTANQVHRVTIAVADASDELLDSDAFFLSHSLTSP